MQRTAGLAVFETQAAERAQRRFVAVALAQVVGGFVAAARASRARVIGGFVALARVVGHLVLLLALASFDMVAPEVTLGRERIMPSTPDSKIARVIGSAKSARHKVIELEQRA